MAETTFDERTTLKQHPNASRWTLELQRILNGEREQSLLNVQSVSSYINKILAESDDPSLARAHFSEALMGLVRAWQPSAHMSKEYFACMLDILGAYTPLEGMPKILSTFKRWGGFPDDLKSSQGYGAEYDINLKALVVLESYFPIGPHENLKEDVRSFSQYLEILFGYLNKSTYSSYVAVRLIELGALTFDDQRIGEIITTDPESLYHLLSIVFSTSQRENVSLNLAAIWSHFEVVDDAIKQAFFEALKIYGATGIELTNGEIQVQLDEQESFILKSTASSSSVIEPVHEDAIGRQSLVKRLDSIPTLLANVDASCRREVSILFEECLLQGSDFVERFKSKVNEAGGELLDRQTRVEIITKQARFRPTLSKKGLVGWVAWKTHKIKVPSKQNMIEELRGRSAGG